MASLKVSHQISPLRPPPKKNNDNSNNDDDDDDDDGDHVFVQQPPL